MTLIPWMHGAENSLREANLPTVRLITLIALLVPMMAFTPAGVAQATDLYTPPVFVGAAANCVICNLVNTTATAKTVRIQIIGSDGSIRKDDTFSVPAHGNTGGNSFLFPSLSVPADYYYCHFNTNAVKSAVRGFIAAHVGCVSSGSYTLPAQ